MTGYIVVGGLSKDGITFKKGFTFLAPHLFPTQILAKAWIESLKFSNPEMEFIIHAICDDALPRMEGYSCYG